MNAITSCCAPAPIDSIATTAATPKIIPSIVSSERSLCARRFSRPRRNSGRTSADQRWVLASIIGCRGASPRRPPLHAHSRGPLTPLRSRGSLAVARSRRSLRHAGGGSRRGLRTRRRDVGIDERDDVPFVQAADDRAALGGGDDL